MYTPGIWYYMYIVYIHVPGIWWCPRGAGMGKVCVSHSVCLAAALPAGAMATRGGGGGQSQNFVMTLGCENRHLLRTIFHHFSPFPPPSPSPPQTQGMWMGEGVGRRGEREGWQGEDHCPCTPLQPQGLYDRGRR